VSLRLLEDDCLTRYREMLRVGVEIPLDAQQALLVHIDGLSGLLERERAAVRRGAQFSREMRWLPFAASWERMVLLASTMEYRDYYEMPLPSPDRDHDIITLEAMLACVDQHVSSTDEHNGEAP
jgi:hypothetical protein